MISSGTGQGRKLADAGLVCKNVRQFGSRCRHQCNKGMSQRWISHWI